MAPAEKSNRSSYRRKRRRSKRPKKVSDQGTLPPRQMRKGSKANGELPKVFIYTYTIYKSLD